MNLRNHARAKECKVRIPGICNRDDTTTVLAHLRLAGITGAGQKAPDILGAHACSCCHTATEKTQDLTLKVAFYEGIFRTQYELIKEGVLKW